MNLNFLKPVYMEGEPGAGGGGGGGDEPTLESLAAQLADITKSNDLSCYRLEKLKFTKYKGIRGFYGYQNYKIPFY